MEETIGPFIIERVWNAADGGQVCRIVWTAEQLQRIGQAVEEGDQAFLAEIEQVMRRALDIALTPQKG